MNHKKNITKYKKSLQNIQTSVTYSNFKSFEITCIKGYITNNGDEKQGTKKWALIQGRPSLVKKLEKLNQNV